MCILEIYMSLSMMNLNGQYYWAIIAFYTWSINFVRSTLMLVMHGSLLLHCNFSVI